MPILHFLARIVVGLIDFAYSSVNYVTSVTVPVNGGALTEHSVCAIKGQFR